jgi:alpha-galactosidase
LRMTRLSVYIKRRLVFLMVDRFKLAYIGAGSFRFSIGFFCNIVNAVELMPMEVALCDIDVKSLELMTKILRKMVTKAAKSHQVKDCAAKLNGFDVQVTASPDRRQVLANADIVFKSLSVGLQESEWIDINLPLKFGIPQNTGDTVGPGGLFRNLRTDPVVTAIARDMRELCPKAPMLSYTNPQSALVLAARTAIPQVQFIGLCHELFGGMRTLQAYFNAKYGLTLRSWEELDIEYGGVNHFSFLTKVAYKGQDLYPKLREDADHLLKTSSKHRAFLFYLLKQYGYYNYVEGRHVAEFLPDYYNYFNHRKDAQCPLWEFPEIRSVHQIHMERRGAYFWFRNIARGVVPTPKPRKKGERAMEMTLDWRTNTPTHHVVNIPNNGTIPELPDDCIVEVPGYFKDGEIRAVGTIHLPKEIAALIRPHCEVQRLVADAALGNSYEKVLKAMESDPMCRWIEDDAQVEALTKIMLFYEQQWLPQEWKEWIPRESELRQSKWWVDPREMARTHKGFQFFTEAKPGHILPIRRIAEKGAPWHGGDAYIFNEIEGKIEGCLQPLFLHKTRALAHDVIGALGFEGVEGGVQQRIIELVPGLLIEGLEACVVGGWHF